MLALGVVVLVACFIFPPNIFWLMLFVGTVFASSWGPVGLMSVWSKNITESAAFWGMTLGFVFNVGPALLEYREVVDLPEYFSPTIIGLLASFSAIFYCNRKHAVTKEEADFRQKLHITPEVDRDHKKTLITMIPPALLVIYGMVMPFVMLNFLRHSLSNRHGTATRRRVCQLADRRSHDYLGVSVYLYPAGVFCRLVHLAQLQSARQKIKSIGSGDDEIDLADFFFHFGCAFPAFWENPTVASANFRHLPGI